MTNARYIESTHRGVERFRRQRACAQALLGEEPRRLLQDAGGAPERRAPRAGNARTTRADRAAGHAKCRWPASRGGSKNVIDLHGRIDTVRCLGCGQRTSRDELQRELERRNPSFAALDAVEAPDGDADLEGVAFETFDVPACDACGGLLKPDVVFFGENVPAERVQRAMAPIASSDAMLVVGSSLMIYSGYRFVTAAADAGKPIAAINLGRTRADDLLTLKVEDRCSDALRLLT